MIKVLRIIAIVFGVYVALVAAFEAFIGWAQGGAESMAVITTRDANGNAKERVLGPFESEGRIYVAANHWPRAWYTQLLENPHVQLRLASETDNYVAVPIVGQELERIRAEYRLPFWVRMVTGFPPRRFVRLDPEGVDT